MEHQPFTIAQMRPIRDCMTVSRPANLGKEVPVTWFSLGAGGRAVPFAGDDFLAVPPKTLCGTSTDIGMIYTEIILKKENTILNNIIKAGQPTALKDLISYEEGSIANVDLVHADNMKFVLMAFDAGTSLPPTPRPRQRHPDRTGRQSNH